ncbi:MAG: CCA tRNA nucleotidyltransferase [Lachnospiraceae bacterium]|nr:CCA tRNA nucleotidyltransferase [Lachnospiraceae bacterium]
MFIELPENVKRIIETLQDNGFEAYAVGGCVRDSILGRTPGDWDITTSAEPYEIKAIFRRTVDTGIQHGTVTVLLDSDAYEVTTYRVDGNYSDSRHPDSVTFTRNLEEDLLRRDFTINAMAYNDADGLKDIYGGMEDLEKGIIRCVGVPEDRFGEDALRMLRAVRFSAQLGFELDPDTEEAVKKLCGDLTLVSAERIQTELKKLLMSKRPVYVKKLEELGITEHVLTWISTDEQILEMLRCSDEDYSVRLAILLSEDPENVATRLRELKLDNHTIDLACGILNNKDRPMDPARRYVRHFLSKTGEELFREIVKYKKAEACGNKEQESAADETLKTAESVLGGGECLFIKDLKISGSDIIKMGCPQGPKVGDVLEALLQKVLDEPGLNDAVSLREMAEEMVSGFKDDQTV